MLCGLCFCLCCGFRLLHSKLAMAETKTVRIKNVSEEARKNKKERDRSRGKTRVELAKEFARWRLFKAQLDCKTDSAFASVLLDCYEKLNEATSTVKSEPSSPTAGPQQDHYEKLNEATSTVKSEPSSPTAGPQQDQDEKPQITTPSPLSGPLLAKCPSCGFALPQWCLENGNLLKDESIEVTLGLEQKDDPVSGPEEADGDSDEEEESEGSGVDEEKGGEEENSDEDWTPDLLNQTQTNTKPTETPAAEPETMDPSETDHRPGKWKLCTECGMFYRKKPHECEHKTKPFVCNICGRRCVSETALKIHNRIHSESYEHPCKYCYANFKTRVDKLAHELIHQAQQDPYKCPDCSMTFETFNGRTEHMKEHGNDFKCALCGIVFNRKSQFLRHLVVHTGEKAFKCSFCERSFKQPSHLKSHMRLHTGEKPYSCRHCDKSFNHNVSLKSHLQRYHPKEEEEDISRETQETGTVRNEENKRPARRKNRHPRSGRPKGRPKTNTAKKIKYSITMDEAGEESE